MWDRRWLSNDEKKIAIRRLRDNQTGIKNTEFKSYQIKEALLDPKTWLFFFLSIATQVVNGAVSNFGSLIVKGFGFSSLNATLLQVPYGFIILFANVSAMYLQRYIPGQQRCMVGSLYVIPALAGTVGIHTIGREHKAALLACYYVSSPLLDVLSPFSSLPLTPISHKLTAIYTASFSMIMSLLTANTAGSTKRSVVNAVFFVAYCVGNIVGPFAFKTEEAPQYISGIIAILVAYCCEIALLAAFAMYAIYLNKQKKVQLDELVAANAAGEHERAQASFSDSTDGENPFFHFTY